MSEQYLAELRLFSFNFPPKGWALCDGQLLPINQNQALFDLLGTTYGGDGRVNFALPNLQGRVPLHFGDGVTQGQRGGEEAHTLNVNETPTHTHPIEGTSFRGTSSSPAGNVPAATAANVYIPPASSTSSTLLAPKSITSSGEGQPHENRQPFLTLNICIALQGIFPSQN